LGDAAFGACYARLRRAVNAPFQSACLRKKKANHYGLFSPALAAKMKQAAGDPLKCVFSFSANARGAAGCGPDALCI
jgi:hypothetical protein